MSETIPVIYGTQKVAGRLIWTGNTIYASPQSASSISWAMALCFGEAYIMRFWEGKAEHSRSTLDALIAQGAVRVYDGASAQTPDPHIASFLPRTPAWKGLCYIVRENYPLFVNSAGETSGKIPEHVFEVRRENFTTTNDQPYQESLPTEVSKDILTNKVYGIGLPSSAIDQSSFDNTASYATANNLLVSVKFDEQESILDALKKISIHHDGFFTASDGKIAHRQYKTETVLKSVSISNLVVKTKSTKPPVTVKKTGFRELVNRIIAKYFVRTGGSEGYMEAAEIVDDIVHQDKFGIKDKTLDLEMFVDSGRTILIANRTLRKVLDNPLKIQITIGPKDILNLPVGGLFAFTDQTLGLSNTIFRVRSANEAPDFKTVLECIEEKEHTLNIIPQSTRTPWSPPDLGADPGNVDGLFVFEYPPQMVGEEIIRTGIAYSSSGQLSWAGASIYQSYDATNYSKLKTMLGGCLCGYVTEAGMANDTPYIDVTLWESKTLDSAADMDALLQTPNKNRCVSENGYFFRFVAATLQSGDNWRLTGIIWDVFGEPSINTVPNVQVNEKMLFFDYLNNPADTDYQQTDIGRTLYYKTPSINYYNDEQDIATLPSINESIDGLAHKPLPPANLEAQGMGTISTIENGDIIIAWLSRNRFDEGQHNYARADMINDDNDFQNFEVEVWSGSNLLRTAYPTGKTYAYPYTSQITDGGPYTSLTFKVRQVSNVKASDDATLALTLV